jgi:hypothetical protein
MPIIESVLPLNPSTHPPSLREAQGGVSWGEVAEWFVQQSEDDTDEDKEHTRRVGGWRAVCVCLGRRGVGWGPWLARTTRRNTHTHARTHTHIYTHTHTYTRQVVGKVIGRMLDVDYTLMTPEEAAAAPDGEEQKSDGEENAEQLRRPRRPRDAREGLKLFVHPNHPSVTG